MAKLEDSFRVVTVGDGAVGKTCLLVCYSEKRFPEEYVPTIFENYHVNQKYEDQYYGLELYDTAGQENLSDLRRLSYPDTNVFLLCFGISDPVSFKNVKTFWGHDLKENGPKDSVIILVGTKQDLREDAKTLKELKKEELSPISKEEGEEASKEIGAVAYVETSSLQMRGIKELFEVVVEMAVRKLNENREGKKQKKKGMFQSLGESCRVEEEMNYFKELL